MRSKTRTAGVFATLAAGLLIAAAPVMAAVGSFHASTSPVQDVSAGSGPNVSGSADLTLRGVNLTAHITASGLSPNLPHLMHIHGVLGALSDCPNASADVNEDGFIDTAEGLPDYGPILVTFSTSGSTSAGAGLTLSTAVVADSSGRIDYLRTFRIPGKIAIKLSDLHVVIHGADLNGNGAYDGIDGSLGAGIPLEAEIPVSCGTINKASAPESPAGACRWGSLIPSAREHVRSEGAPS